MKQIAAMLLFLPIIILASVLGGTVRDSEGKKIPYVNVYLKESMKGDMADSAGYFQIDDVKEGDYTVIARLIGYREYSTSIHIDRGESKYIQIMLESEAFEMKGVEVTSERSDFKYDISISKRTYNRSDLKKSPAVVQSDIMKSFQMLPSVTAASDFSSALYVRGGAPDQNLIRYDRAPVFNPFHLGGMFSTFDVNIIESAEFYAGGFDASYGNRVSSVIDIRTITPSGDFLGINYDLSLLSASASLTLNPPGGFYGFIQGRRTYFDKMLDIIDQYFPYYFYDISGKMGYRFSNYTNMSLSYFTDEDIIDLSLGDSLDLFDDKWGNTLFSYNISHVMQDGSRIDGVAYYSRYSNNLNLLDIVKIATGIDERGGNICLCKPIGQADLSAGAELYRNQFIYEIVVNDSDSLFNIKDNPYYGAVFVNGSISMNDNIIATGGLRFEKYQFKRPIYLSPRAGIKFFVGQETALTLNYGHYRQFITSVKQETNDFSSVFGEMWMPVYGQYEPQLLRQFIVGLEHWFNDNTFVSIEAYNKDYENLVHSTLTDLIVHMDDPTKAFNETGGLSRGLELLFKKTSGPLTGWVGYAYSVTEFVKDSNYVLTYYDKTHTLNINLIYSLPWGMGLSTSLVFASGSPYTAVIGKYKHYSIDPVSGQVDDYSWNEFYSAYNEARFPPYFRWDMGVSKEFNIGRLKNRVSLSIVNMTNHDNVFFYYYDHDVNPSARYDFNMLPFLPSIGVSGEF